MSCWFAKTSVKRGACGRDRSGLFANANGETRGVAETEGLVNLQRRVRQEGGAEKRAPVYLRKREQQEGVAAKEGLVSLRKRV